eukprot:gene2592-3345_t
MSNETEESAFDGVPLYMRRKAKIMTGGDRAAMLEFVRANADQPNAFWFTEPQVEEILRSRSSELLPSLPKRSADAAKPETSNKAAGERLSRTRSAHVGALQSLGAPSDGRGHGLRSHGAHLSRTSSQRIAEGTVNIGLAPVAGQLLERAATAPADLGLAPDAPQALPSIIPLSYIPQAPPLSSSHSATQVPSAEALRTAVMDTLAGDGKRLWEAADAQWRRLSMEVEDGKEARWTAGVGRRDLCEVHLPRLLLRNDTRLAWAPPYNVRPVTCRPEVPATGGSSHPWSVGTRVRVLATLTDPLSPSSRHGIDAGSTATILAYHRTDAGVHGYLVQEEARGVSCWGHAVEDSGSGKGRGRHELERLADAGELELQVGGLLDVRLDGASMPSPWGEQLEGGMEVWVPAQIVEVMDAPEEPEEPAREDVTGRGGKGEKGSGGRQGARKGGKGAGRRQRNRAPLFGAPLWDAGRDAAGHPPRRSKPARIKVIFNDRSLPDGLRDVFPRFGGSSTGNGSTDGNDASVRTYTLHLQHAAVPMTSSSSVPSPWVQPLGTRTSAATTVGDEEVRRVKCGVCREDVWEQAHPLLPFEPAVPCGSCPEMMHHRCASAVREALQREPSGAEGPGTAPVGKEVSEASSATPCSFCFACAEGSLPEVWVPARIRSRRGGEGEEGSQKGRRGGYRPMPPGMMPTGMLARMIRMREDAGRARKGLLSSLRAEDRSAHCGEDAVLRDVEVVVFPKWLSPSTPAKFVSALQALGQLDEEEGVGVDAANPRIEEHPRFGPPAFGGNPFGPPAFGGNPFGPPAFGGGFAAFGRGVVRNRFGAIPVPGAAPHVGEGLPQPNPFGGRELAPKRMEAAGMGETGVQLCISGDAATTVRAPRLSCLSGSNWPLTPGEEVEVKACFARHYRHGGKEYLATAKAEWRWVRGIVLQRTDWLHGSHLLVVDFQVEHEVSLGSMPSFKRDHDDMTPPSMTTLFVANIGGAFEDRSALEEALEEALTRVAGEVVLQMLAQHEANSRSASAVTRSTPSHPQGASSSSLAPAATAVATATSSPVMRSDSDPSGKDSASDDGASDDSARCFVKVLGADWHPGRSSATVCVTFERRDALPEGLNALQVYEQVVRRLHGVEVQELMKYATCSPDMPRHRTSCRPECPTRSNLMQVGPCADCRAWSPRVAEGQRLVLALAADVECFIKAAEYGKSAADAAAASTSKQKKVQHLVATSLTQDIEMQRHPVVQVEGFERPCMLVATQGSLGSWLSRAATAVVAEANPELLLGQTVCFGPEMQGNSVGPGFRRTDSEDEAHLRPVGQRDFMERNDTPRFGFAEVIGHLAHTGEHLVDASPLPWTSAAALRDDKVKRFGPEDFLLARCRGVSLKLHRSVADQDAIAPVGVYTAECSVCYDMRSVDEFPSVCLQPRDGDGGPDDEDETRGAPRHPPSICRACVERHALTSLRDGKLFVVCPVEGCGRSLQTRELEALVPSSEYLRLLERLREAEQQSDADDSGTPGGLALPTGMVGGRVADLYIRTSREGDGSGALLKAVQSGDAATARDLLNGGADPNAVSEQDSEQRAPLHWAALEGYTAIVELLLENGADLHCRDRFGDPALNSAIKEDRLATVETLLKAGAQVNGDRGDSARPLNLAARFGSIPVLEALVQAGAALQIHNEDGATPLHSAIIAGSLPNTNFLLKAGAEVDAIHLGQGDSPLFVMIHRHHVQPGNGVLEALMQAGADVNQVNRSRDTPLRLAVRRGCVWAVDALLQHGAKVNANGFGDDDSDSDLDDEGWNPNGPRAPQIPLLHESLLAPVEDSTRVAIVEALIKAGVGVDELSPNIRGGQTPLCVAADNGFVLTAAALIRAGADVNHRDALLGSTVLKITRSDEIKELLVAHGASAK